MTKTPDDLLRMLDEGGFAVTTVRHPPLRTVAESQALRGTVEGAHTKNLFLKDKKGRLFLVTVEESAEVDLKTIHKAIGASSRVSFASAEALWEHLGVLPGSVTPFGAVNDAGHAVTFVLDAALMENDIVNAHPLTNEATTSIKSGDLSAFMRACGRDPLVLNVTAGSPH